MNYVKIFLVLAVIKNVDMHVIMWSGGNGLLNRKKVTIHSYKTNCGSVFIQYLHFFLLSEQIKEACANMVRGKLEVPLRVVKMNFLGLPRSGKSTLLKRLMEIILNIKSLADIREEPSTGVAERSNQILINVGMADDQSWKITDKIKQLPKCVSKIIFQSLKEESTSKLKHVFV